MNFLTVDTLYNALKEPLKLRLVTQKGSLTRKIHTAEIHRPGLALYGYYEHFSFARIQILGQTEIAYIESTPRATISKSLDKFFSYNIPCLLVSKDLKIPKDKILAITVAH
jgi:HPr kinase/phosphorylase